MTKSPSKFIQTAAKVLEIEARALDQLKASLDDRFDAAIEAILNCKGRVVVSGMGKSGHVGKKIAATFASTGTPAIFVHPAEASHGDLGMITPEDVLLVLSNSGETPELSDVVAHARRYGITLIGVAGKKESTLLKQSTIALCLPPTEEACGHGIVPTTSTTMTIALGDALAIALMEHRHFTPEDFRAFHPGGKLGARLAKVEDMMHSEAELPLITQETSMPDALIEISQKGFGIAGVVNGDHDLVGVITDGDLRRHLENLFSLHINDVMSQNPTTIPNNALAEDALRIMNQKKITSLFVTNPNAPKRPVGLLHMHDLIRAGLR